MIFGIGVDMVEIERMNNSHMSEHVIERMFHPLEIEQVPQQLYAKKEYFASRFASKEALVKALKIGFREIAPRDIAVLNDELGKPYFIYSDKVKELLPVNLSSIHLSLSHEKNVAIAFVLIEVTNEY